MKNKIIYKKQMELETITSSEIRQKKYALLNSWNLKNKKDNKNRRKY